jgi:hypothetical protein
MAEQGSQMPSAGSFLSVGLSLQLCFVDQQGNAQYGSSLLGWKTGDWMICEWPYHLGRPVPCRVNEPCLVRYMYDGRFIGYPSVIRDRQLEPFPFLYLAFPQSVEELALRKHARVSFKDPLPIKISECGPAGRRTDRRTIDGLMHDLSLTGCCVALPARAAWTPGTAVCLAFELRGIGHVSNLSGVVKNVAEGPRHTELGIEFIFTGTEFIEYRGWGGTVRKAIESCVLQKSAV